MRTRGQDHYFIFDPEFLDVDNFYAYTQKPLDQLKHILCTASTGKEKKTMFIQLS